MLRASCLALFLVLVACSACSSQTEDTGIAAVTRGWQNGSFTADLQGAKIHYEVHGNGPVLMVLPNSWGINIPALRAYYRPLETKVTMVYFDPRGMGASDPVKVDADTSAATVRRDFDALRQRLGLAKVNVIGWSNGAMNLVLLASEKPETIATGIFLHGMASFTEEDRKASVKQHPEVAKAYGRFMEEMKQTSMTDQDRNARLRRLWLDEYFPIMAADPAATKPKVEAMFKECPFSWRHVSYSQKEWPTFDARDRLGRISSPSLILAGAKDSVPVAKAEEMKQGIKNSRLVVFQNSGHFAPLEEPEAFQREVLAWLTTDN